MANIPLPDPNKPDRFGLSDTPKHAWRAVVDFCLKDGLLPMILRWILAGLVLVGGAIWGLTKRALHKDDGKSVAVAPAGAENKPGDFNGTATDIERAHVIAKKPVPDESVGMQPFDTAEDLNPFAFPHDIRPPIWWHGWLETLAQSGSKDGDSRHYIWNDKQLNPVSGQRRMQLSNHVDGTCYLEFSIAALKIPDNDNSARPCTFTCAHTGRSDRAVLKRERGNFINILVYDEFDQLVENFWFRFDDKRADSGGLTSEERALARRHQALRPIADDGELPLRPKPRPSEVPPPATHEPVCTILLQRNRV
jgi:hypothetical protein